MTESPHMCLTCNRCLVSPASLSRLGKGPALHLWTLRSLLLSLGWDPAVCGQELCPCVPPGFQFFPHHQIWSWFSQAHFTRPCLGLCSEENSIVSLLSLQSWVNTDLPSSFSFESLGFICAPSFWCSGHLLQSLLLTYYFVLSRFWSVPNASLNH